MQLELLNEQGQATSKGDAPDTVFARDYNEALVHQVVVAFQANARVISRSDQMLEEGAEIVETESSINLEELIAKYIFEK